MKVHLSEDYILTADACNFILSKKRIAQSGKKKGEETLDTIGYYPLISQALTSFVNENMRECTARTVKGLVNRHTELCGYIKDLFDTKKKAFGDLEQGRDE